MSKRTFYIDFHAGFNAGDALYATTVPPMPKTAGTKRVAFEVTIPDELIHEVDGYAAEVSRPRIVEYIK